MGRRQTGDGGNQGGTGGPGKMTGVRSGKRGLAGGRKKLPTDTQETACHEEHRARIVDGKWEVSGLDRQGRHVG